MITNSSHNSVPQNKVRPRVNIGVSASIYINVLLSFTFDVKRLRTTMNISIIYEGVLISSWPDLPPDVVGRNLGRPAGFRLNQQLGNWASHVSGLGQTFMKIWTFGRSPRGSCSCMTMPRLTGHLQRRRNWPTCAPMS
jgi:hypothetical protein